MGIKQRIQQLRMRGLSEAEAEREARKEEAEDEAERRKASKERSKRVPSDHRTKKELRADLRSADRTAKEKRAGDSPKSEKERAQREKFIQLHGQDD